MTVAVDFDSTVVKDKWPWKGEDVPGAEETLKKLVKAGHRLILLTQREHLQQGSCPDVLQVALDWFSSKGIRLWAINSNPTADTTYYPARKVYADVYIDDHNIGIPRVDYLNEAGEYSPYVDWDFVDAWFKGNGYYD